MWENKPHPSSSAYLAGSWKNKNWCWIEIEQAAFDEAKEILAQEVILSYPDFSKPFEIHSDTSEFHLGAVFKQDGKTFPKAKGGVLQLTS